MALKKKVKKRKIIKKRAKKPIRKKAKKTVKRALKKRTVSKKSPKKRPSIKKKNPKKSPKKQAVRKQGGNLIGMVTHYFPRVQAGVIKLKKPLSAGEGIKITGHTTNFTQVIGSMQINRVNILKAKPGDEIGLRVSSRVRQGDKVFKI
jgi:putative protease